MANYSTSTLGGVTLQVTNISVNKPQKTRKSVVGKSLVQVQILGLNAQQWELRIDGIITAATVAALGTARAALEALDNAGTHAYVDGIHDGTYYIVPGSLSFSDAQELSGVSYRYSLTIIEE